MSDTSYIRIFAPATVANVGPGYDVMGFAIDGVGDILRMQLNDQEMLRLCNETDFEMPLEPAQNVASVAIQAMLDQLDVQQGIDIIFEQKILPGSGIGSSSASAAAAVFGANQLLGNPFDTEELVYFAMIGEQVADGAWHADNVAPAVLGGVVLIRGYEPEPDFIQLPFPETIYCALVHPQVSLRTADSRAVLPKEIPLNKAVNQWGNLASLVAGFALKDIALIGRSLQDEIIEPARAGLIPGFAEIKAQVLETTALGMSISGAGPSIFSLCADKQTAERVLDIYRRQYEKLGIDHHCFLSPISALGTRIL